MRGNETREERKREKHLNPEKKEVLTSFFILIINFFFITGTSALMQDAVEGVVGGFQVEKKLTHLRFVQLV